MSGKTSGNFSSIELQSNDKQSAHKESVAWNVGGRTFCNNLVL